jgi:cell division transport system permease protein
VSRAAFRHTVSEAWSIFRSGKGRTALSTVLIALSLYVPGLLLLVSQNVSRLASRVESPVSVVVTLQPGADARALAAELSRMPGVAQVRLVWPPAARERFVRAFPDLKEALARVGDLQFPPTLEIALVASAPESSSAAIAAWSRKLPGVEEAQDQGDLERRFRDGVALLRRAAFAVGLLLCAAAVLSIASAVRLALDQHRDEIEIMRLMGATESAIRAPFWLHGAEQGAAGGALAWGLLAATYRIAVVALSRHSHPILALLWVKFLPVSVWALFLVAGAAAGLAGAVISVGRKSVV